MKYVPFKFLLVSFFAISTACPAAERQVRLVDFRAPKVVLTLGGEFPGAEGALTNVVDGSTALSRIDFDLTKGNYEGFEVPIPLDEGAQRIAFSVRATGWTSGSVFFRAVDSAGQTHYQPRQWTLGTDWTNLVFSAKDNFPGHWGGANDGRITWPLKTFVLGFTPGKGNSRVGRFELRDVVLTTTVDEQKLPGTFFTTTSPRFGALWQEHEKVVVECVADCREVGVVVPPRNLSVVVTDWQEREVLRRDLGLLPPGVPRAIEFSTADLKNRFGAYRAVFTLRGPARSATSGSSRLGEAGPPGGGSTRGPARSATGQMDLVSTNWFGRFAGRTPPKPCPWIGTGVHGGHGWGRGDLRFLDIIATAGIGIIRDEVGWANCEKEKGVYQLPEKFDALLTGLKDRGIRINHALTYTNPLYKNPCDEDAFASWAKWLAATCRGRVDHYEIWNEPQNFAFKTTYGGLDAPDTVWIDKFVSFTRKAVDAVRAGDPSATVAVTSEDCWNLLEDMVSKNIARKDDLVSFHPYCHGQPRPEREMVFKDEGRVLRRLMAKHGGASRLCVTEAGWTTYSGPGTYLAVAGGYPRSSYVHQAQYLVRMYTLARQIGCDYAIQYDFKNDGSDRGYTEHNFGMVFEDYSPKPSLAAVACLSRMVGAAEPLGDMSYDPSHFRVYRFRQSSGEEVSLAWSIEGETAVPVPAAVLAKMSCRDLMGNPIPLPMRDGRLVLTECPIYLSGFEASAFTQTPRVEVVMPVRRAVGGEAFPLEVTFPEMSGGARPVTCRMSFDFGNGVVNEQTVKFQVGSIGAMNASNVIRKDGKYVMPVTVWGNSALATDVTVTVTSPLLDKPQTGHVAVKPDLAGMWSVPLDRAPGEKGAPVQLVGVFSNGMKVENRGCWVRSAFVPTLPKTPSFTGKASEWDGAAAPAAAPRWVPGKLAQAPRPEDSSCSAKVGCTGDGLLFRVQVRDDLFFQPFSNNRDAVEADSIQIGFTRLYTSRCGKTTIAAFHDKKGAWQTVVKDSVRSLPGSGVVKAVYTPLSETEGVYEVLVPWSRLGDSRETKAVRFAIRVNENDGDGLKGAWEIHGGVANDNETWKFGTYSHDCASTP